jgi:hypothetical protein
MSKTGHYSGGHTIIKAFVPRSAPRANRGGALASWIEDFRTRPTPKPYLSDGSWRVSQTATRTKRTLDRQGPQLVR